MSSKNHPKHKRARSRWKAPAGGGGGGLPGLPHHSLDATAPSAASAIHDQPTVAGILSNLLGPLVPGGEFPLRTIIADRYYCGLSPGFALNAILTDPVLSSPSSYQPDIFDCDDYVLHLKTKLGLYAATQRLPAPPAIGYVFTTDHALSFCVDDAGVLFLINTQSANHAIVSDPADFATFLELYPANPITCIHL